MPYQRVTIPLVHGLDQSIDERVRPPDRLAKVINGFFDKTGAVCKRHGFTAVETLDQGQNDITSCRRLFSTGEELCMLDDRFLYAQNPEWGKWINRGRVSPFSGKQEPVFNGEAEYRSMDAMSYGGYTAMGYCRTFHPDILSSHVREFGVTIRSDDGSTVYADEATPILTGTGPSTDAHAVRCAWATGKLLIGVCFEGRDPTILRIYAWSTASPANAAPALANTVSANVDYLGDDIRPYDMVGLVTTDGLASGDYVVAWIDATSNTIELERFDSSHVSQDTGTISAPAFNVYRRVAIAHDTVNDKIVVLAAREDSSNIWVVEIHQLDDGDFVSNWTTTLDTLSSGERVENVGVAAGLNTAAAMRYQAIWNNWETSTSVRDRCRVDMRTVNAAGAATVNLMTTYNLWARSKPFWVSGVPYFAGDTTLASHALASAAIFGSNNATSYIFDTAGIYEIDLGNEQTYVVGIHNVSKAADVSNLGFSHCRHGGGQNVYQVSSGQYAFMSYVEAYSFLDTVTPQLYTKHEGDEVRLTWGNVPGVCVLPGPVAVIGGGLVGYYDGEITVELGHVGAPIPFENSSAAGGTLTASTDYDHQCIWHFQDAKGFLHRSAPSFVRTFPTAAGEGTINMYAKSTPCTLRYGTRSQAVIWYRVDSDGLPKRITEPSRMQRNRTDTWFTEQFDDNGQEVQDLLYTVSGELEAIAPEGASFCVQAGGRLWLGDFFRRSRVAYSKPFAPGTGASVAFAPEFNEAFTYILDIEDEVTALAEMDDQLIIFTATAIYTISGDGPANDGSANNFSGLRLISNDAGCIDERSVVGYPEGVMFQSSAGIYELTRGNQVRFIGQNVMDELESRPEVTSAVLDPTWTQVRFTVRDDDNNSSRILVYDYSIKEWTVWHPRLEAGSAYADHNIASACMHNGDYYFATKTGAVYRYDTSTWLDAANGWVPLTIETGWFQGAQQSGWQRVRKVAALCSRLSACDITVSLFTNFDGTNAVKVAEHLDAVLQTYPDPANALQRLSRVPKTAQRSFALKVQITDNLDSPSGTGEGYNCAGITLEWLPKRGMFKPAVEQRG